MAMKMAAVVSTRVRHNKTFFFFPRTPQLEDGASTEKVYVALCVCVCVKGFGARASQTACLQHTGSELTTLGTQSRCESTELVESQSEGAQHG